MSDNSIEVKDSSGGSILIRVYRPEGYEDVHPEILLDDLKIHPDFRAEVVAQSPRHDQWEVERVLRDGVRAMATMLENKEWANVLSTDEDLARLDAAITAALTEAKKQAGEGE